MNLLTPKFSITFDKEFVPEQVGLYYFFDATAPLMNEDDKHGYARSLINRVLESDVPALAGVHTARILKDVNLLHFNAASAAEREDFARRNINYVGKVAGSSVVWGNRLSNGAYLVNSRVLASAVREALSSMAIGMPSSDAAQSFRTSFTEFMQGPDARHLDLRMESTMDAWGGTTVQILVSMSTLIHNNFDLGTITLEIVQDTANFTLSDNLKFLTNVFDLMPSLAA